MGKGKAKKPKGRGGGGNHPQNPGAGTQRPRHGSHDDSMKSNRATISKKKQKKIDRREAAAIKPQQKGPKGAGSCLYSPLQKTLLLGEGDFSFAAALALSWRDATNLIATAYDDEADASSKYAALAENVETIRSLGGVVLFGVDAAKCERNKSVAKRAPYQKVIFNFPHTGLGIKDQARNIASNQELIRGSFQACAGMLGGSSPEVHITLKKGEPYTSWNVVTIAKMCGFRVHFCNPFNPLLFPGYAHKRTIGDEHAGVGVGPNAEISGSRTYAFAPHAH